MKLESFVEGKWISGRERVEIRSAVSGHVVAEAYSGGLDIRSMLAHARTTGGTNLRKLTFHQRADLLKGLAQYLQNGRISSTSYRSRPVQRGPTTRSTWTAASERSLSTQARAGASCQTPHT